VKLKLCPQCKRPFLASEEFCPKCPRLEWDQENWVNVGCLLATIVPLFVLILFWLILFFGIIFR
jgi:predicted amidophosphoribosyltransferase